MSTGAPSVCPRHSDSRPIPKHKGPPSMYHRSGPFTVCPNKITDKPLNCISALSPIAADFPNLMSVQIQPDTQAHRPATSLKGLSTTQQDAEDSYLSQSPHMTFLQGRPTPFFKASSPTILLPPPCADNGRYSGLFKATALITGATPGHIQSHPATAFMTGAIPGS